MWGVEIQQSSSLRGAHLQRENSSLDWRVVAHLLPRQASKSNSHSLADDWAQVTNRWTKPQRERAQVATQQESTVQPPGKPVVLMVP